MKQKRYWREHDIDVVNVLYIGMSEIDTGVVDVSPEPCSRAVARNPQNDGISLHAVSMVGYRPEHLGCAALLVFVVRLVKTH